MNSAKLIFTLALLVSALGATSARADYRYRWYSDGSCGEDTLDGYLVRTVDITSCERSVGYKFGWYTDGSCGEQTPDGYLVKYVDRSNCER